MASLQNLNFVPTSIAGCQLWLDANDRNTLSLTGSNVNQWNDKSGNGRNAIYSLSNFATISSSSSGLSFSNTYYTTTYTADPTNETLFIAFRSFSQSNRIMLSSPNPNGRFVGIPDTGITPSYSIGFGKDSTTWGATTPITSNANVFTTVQFSSGAFSRISANGGTFSTYTALTFNSGSNTNIGGAFSAGSLILPYTGLIYEIIAYNSVLSTSNTQSVEGYLAWKWGLQGSLPSNHPFKLIAPNSAGLAYPSALTVAAPTQTFAVNPAPFVFNFSPTSVSGCQLWLDAFDRNAVLLSTGSNISRVIDKSPQNLTLTNAVSFTYDATNRAFVGPGGSGPVLGTAAFSLATPACMFIVGAINTTGYFFDGLTSIRRMGSLWNGSQYMGTTVDSTFVYPTLASNPYSTRSVFETVFNGASSLLYRNGTVVQTPSLGSPTLTGLVIGSRFTLTEEALQGTINELIVYNSELGTTQRQQIEGYLAWKWGLQTSLPSNHPFRNAVPGQSITVPIPLITFQPSSFRPTQISGLQLWLDGQDPLNTGTAPANNSTLSTWFDKSGNTKNATGGVSPTFSNSGVVFNGTTQFLTTTYTSSPPAESVFVVGTTTGVVDTFYFILGTGTNSGRGYVVSRSSGIYSVRWDKFEVTSYANTPGISVNTRFLTNGVYTGSAVTTGVNGGSQSASVAATFSGGGTTNIGAITAAVGGFYPGTINEIICYNTVLTTTQRQNVEGYLAWKWGLTANLPATHPFKQFPPPPS